ncbi:AsmA family protein [Parvibium lacunae]|uniref:AsmA family protein n=1 Tax=Parvibium lacunae TaxID=1888893 RepID=A0A368L0G7_9BURK|nr:AsmA family protein [Parvibium lacunae]RCS57053.1 AsmA family protein [Parvibium lacunae]
MRYVKHALWGLGILAITLFGLTLTVSALFNPNDYRDSVRALVKKELQRDIQFGGDLRLRFFPTLAIDLGETVLSEYQSPQPFARVERLQVALAVWPLLRKQLVINHVLLDGPQITLIRRQDGSLNIADLLKPPSPENERPFAFDISKLRIQQGQLTWVDELSQQTWLLDKLQVHTGRLAPNVESGFSLQGRVSQAKQATQVAIELAGRSEFKLAPLALDLKKLRLQLNGRIAQLSDLKTRFELDQLRWEATPANIDLTGLRLQSEGRILAQAGAPTQAFESQWTWPRLQLRAEQAKGEPLNIHFNLTGPQAVEASLVLAEPQGDWQNLQFKQLHLRSHVKNATQTVAAEWRSQLQWNQAKQTLMLPGIALTTRLQTAQLGNKALNGQLNGDLQAGFAVPRVKGQLAGKLGVAKATPVRLEFDWQNRRNAAPGGAAVAVLSVMLELAELNLDELLPPPARAQAATQKPDPDTPLPWSTLLHAPVVEGQVRIGQLQAHGLRLREVNAALALSPGELKLAPVQANLYGGSGRVSLRLNAHQQQLHAEQTLTGVSLEPLLQDLIGRHPVAGRAQLNASLQGQGASLQALKQQLQGAGKLQINDGALSGINIAKTLREWKAKLSLNQDEKQRAKQDEKTDFSELTATFTIRDGTLLNRDLVAKAPFLRLTGAGQANLVKNQLDYLLQANLVNTATGQAGKELQQLHGLTIPIQLTGPFDAVDYHLRWRDLAAGALKGKVNQQLDSAKETLKQQASDQLKGLLGR